MKIYLKNKDTNKLLNIYTNVIKWDEYFVEYIIGSRGKIYCNSDEYFTDEAPETLEENE